MLFVVFDGFLLFGELIIDFGRFFVLVVQLAYKLTKDIVGTYQTCHPEFAFSPDLNPKRYLTAPSTIVSENGLDNEKHDLVLYFNQVLANDDGTRRWVSVFFLDVFVGLCCHFHSEV